MCKLVWRAVMGDIGVCLIVRVERVTDLLSQSSGNFFPQPWPKETRLYL
jgi:hypothetical protein